MEAVPRMPMLAFELKTSPEFVEFGPSLKSVSVKSCVECYLSVGHINVAFDSVLRPKTRNVLEWPQPLPPCQKVHRCQQNIEVCIRIFDSN